MPVVQLENLPQAQRREVTTIDHDYAVGIVDDWYYFATKEPAIAFGQAGRLSADCRQLGGR
jgi:hypothetical protein